MSGILLRGERESWHAPAISGFSSESRLADILASHPSLIPGVSGEAQARRQFPTGAGPADLVVVDEDGAVTFVECILAANPQVRREVVGQVLDYAAQLWRMPLDGVAESLASGSISYWLSTRSTTGNAQWWNTSTRSRSHRPG